MGKWEVGSWKWKMEPMGNGKWVDSGIIWANGSYTGLRYHFYKQGNQNFWLTLQEQQKPLKQISIHSGVSNPLEYNLFVGIVDKKEKTFANNIIQKFLKIVQLFQEYQLIY